MEERKLAECGGWNGWLLGEFAGYPRKALAVTCAAAGGNARAKPETGVGYL